jgi:serine/threonine protein kinase
MEHHLMSSMLQFVAACKKPPVFCIITEFMAGGSLRKYLHQQEPHSVPLNLVLKLALDIARGMSYLHSQGILHRDLKSENILLGEDMSVKVADFGISCLESQCGSGKGFTGTYRWMAPEMIKEEHHTRKVDVYSFGIVMWEILTALVPFSDMTPEQAAVAVALKVWLLTHHGDVYLRVFIEDLSHNVGIHLLASLLITRKPCAECKAATACFMPCGNKPPDHAVLGDQP